jgi:molybdenum cofactor synthesis domain-containing protein
MWRVAMITASDRAAKGERTDDAGPVIKGIISRNLECNIIAHRICPDKIEALKENMIELADRHKADLLITVGGTSLSPEDVTPEATRMVIDRAIPGMAEEMRRKAMTYSRQAMLTRALCGTRGNTLIINLPGAVDAAQYCLQSILDQLPAALFQLQGKREVSQTGGHHE